MRRYELTTSPFTAFVDSFLNDLPTVNQPIRTFTAQNEPYPWATFKVKEHEKGFVIEAELAGVKKENLNIEVIGDTLKVSGSRGSKESDPSKDDYFCSYAEFSRNFSLGSGLDTDRIEAKLENGFLRLFIPNTEAPRAKRIDLK